MGLDMYLTTNVYLGGWNHCTDEEKYRYQRVLAETRLADLVLSSSPDVTVEITVAYWRKANAIHRWFVENIQDGRDECQRSYVPKTELIKLMALCAMAVERYRAGDKDGAAAILPPQDGVFFGGTEVDEYYLEDLMSTLDQLSKLVTDPRPLDFYYRASW